jgi:hypothetical protein
VGYPGRIAIDIENVEDALILLREARQESRPGDGTLRELIDDGRSR